MEIFCKSHLIISFYLEKLIEWTKGAFASCLLARSFYKKSFNEICKIYTLILFLLHVAHVLVYLVVVTHCTIQCLRKVFTSRHPRHVLFCIIPLQHQRYSIHFPLISCLTFYLKVTISLYLARPLQASIESSTFKQQQFSCALYFPVLLQFLRNLLRRTACFFCHRPARSKHRQAAMVLCEP